MYIARDRNGVLFAFATKPNRGITMWCVEEAAGEINYIRLDDNAFPEFSNLKWEDEPVLCKIVKD